MVADAGVRGNAGEVIALFRHRRCTAHSRAE